MSSGLLPSPHFSRINGRISSGEIADSYVAKFGDRYKKRFRGRRDEAEKRFLKSDRVSILSSYNNVITWRNQFAHEGTIPNTVTFQEMKKSYNYGKQLIHCLATTMVR